jgi:amicyanin
MKGFFVAVVLLMAACGGSSDAAQPSASGAAVHTDQVKIPGFVFAPPAIRVVAGATVTWTNEDSIPHSVSAPPAGLTSPDLNPSDTYTHTFSGPGTYHYICSLHPYMRGTVVVTAS